MESIVVGSEDDLRESLFVLLLFENRKTESSRADLPDLSLKLKPCI
jgi:hypothetical protein